jgi:hypothetical protein
MPFRTARGIEDFKVERTFDNLRAALEPTLYAKHFHLLVDPDSWLNPFNAETVWAYIPIPFFFDPESGEIKKAWIVGDLDVRCVVTYTNVEIIARVNAGVEGDDPQEITQLTIPSADASEIRIFNTYFEDLDLSGYDVIGISLEPDAEPAYSFYVSVQLLWRPKFV